MPNYPDSIQDLEPLSGLYIRLSLIHILFAYSPEFLYNCILYKMIYRKEE